MSNNTCEFCFAQFTSSAPTGAETVKCPDCGEETSALPNEAVDSAEASESEGEINSEDWGVSPDEDSETDEYGEVESYGFASSDEEDSYGIGSLEVTGEVISNDELPAAVPVQRTKKKNGKRRKKKKASSQSITNIGSQVVGSIVDIVSGHPKIIAGILIWVVFMVCFKTGTFEIREQKVFHNLTGESRTTGEWLTVVRNYEEQSADGEISMKAKNVYLKISDGMKTFLGPDPAAVPDLFEALQEDPGKSQLPGLAASVLDKFRKNNVKAELSDLEDGLETGHPKVVLWSVRLLAMHRRAASQYVNAIAEFADSDDEEIADAVGVALSQIK